MANFIEMLKQHWQAKRFLCVGLDTDYEKIPAVVRRNSISETIFEYNRAIIEATAPYVCAFKPNVAFYEGYGVDGLEALIQTNQYLRQNYPEIPIILDAKRADIGNTNAGYVKEAFQVLGAQAITVHPYLGQEALQPFLDCQDFGVIVLCHTSNPGAGEFQELKIDGEPLYRIVARRVSTEWNQHGNCCLVVGATYPEQLLEVRQVAPNLPLLIPGIGAQGGDLEATVRNGLTAAGDGIIINASRSVLYASSGIDFQAAAAKEAESLNQAIGRVVAEVVGG